MFTKLWTNIDGLNLEFKDHLIQILQICEDYRLPVIADEIYGDMVFDDNVFHPMATLTSSVPVIAVGGLAKQYLIPGWRVGWVLLYDRNDILDPLRQAYFKLSQLILGAGSLTQVSVYDARLQSVAQSFISTVDHRVSFLIF